VVSVSAVRSRLSESSASTEANMTLRLSVCFFRTPLTAVGWMGARSAVNAPEPVSIVAETHHGPGKGTSAYECMLGQAYKVAEYLVRAFR
jgi:hypothetical protein